MQLIDRYILKSFFLYLVAGLAVFVTLFLTVNFMTMALQNSDAPFTLLLKYFTYETPAVIYQLMPVGCLMATLFTLASLNRSNELTALFSLGLGLRRVATPVLLAVIGISVLMFGFGDQVLPRLLQKRNYVMYVEIKNRPGLYSTVKTNKIWFRTENILYNIKTLNPDAGTAEGITLYYFDPNWSLTQLVTAQQVKMNSSTWELGNGLVTVFAEESSFPLTQTFDKKTISMNENLQEIQGAANSSEIMSVKELRRFIDRNKEAGLDTLRYEVDYHAKFGFAFASFVMSVVGVPFSVGRARSGGTFMQLGICLGLAFAYWVAYSSGITLGSHGLLRPMAAAWVPNILGVGVAWFFFMRLKR